MRAPRKGTVVGGILGVVAIAAFLVVLTWADSLEQKKRDVRYHNCMTLVKRIAKDSDPLDRNELCWMIVR